MNDDPEKPVTLGLSRSRHLDFIDHSADDEIVDPEDAAEDLAFLQEDIAEAQKQDEANRAIGLTGDEREDLWVSFRDHQWIINICNTVLAIVITFLGHAALVVINKRLAGPPNSSSIQLFPSPFAWWIFPPFAGVCLGWESTILLWSLFGNAETIRRYRIWARQLTFNYKTAEFNAMNFNRWFMLLAVLPGGIATVLALPMHAIVGPASIIDCGYGLKACSVYAYADVRRVTRVAVHETSRSRNGLRLALDFKDGRRWITSDWGDEIADVDPALEKFLISRIGLPVNEIDRIEHIPEPK